MWTEAPVNFQGAYYRVENAYCEPRPESPPILMLGMSGEKRAMRVVARYADWWNTGARSPDELRRRLDVLRGHCEAGGRDFDTLRKTLNVRVFLARTQAQALDMVAQHRRGTEHPIAGDPASVRDQLAELADLGFDLSVLTFPRFQELNDMRLFVDEVMPAFS
jgi:alkanesulfonate monooxygenase SsuD/methylene tetrahydromethanopterin reductase-like flavin-dependent oxidoreductase (luciferase family)